jgi:hypothetical protein
VIQTLTEGKGDKSTTEGREQLKKEVEMLKEELKTSGEGQYTHAHIWSLACVFQLFVITL